MVIGKMTVYPVRHRDYLVLLHTHLSSVQCQEPKRPVFLDAAYHLLHDAAMIPIVPTAVRHIFRPHTLLWFSQKNTCGTTLPYFSEYSLLHVPNLWLPPLRKRQLPHLALSINFIPHQVLVPWHKHS